MIEICGKDEESGIHAQNCEAGYDPSHSPTRKAPGYAAEGMKVR